MKPAPIGLDKAFLSWFKLRTEKAWKKGSWKILELGFDVPLAKWQRNMVWLGGASEEEVVSMEKKHGVCFPPDFRLFIRTLRREKYPLSASPWRHAPLFYDWAADTRLIRKRERGLPGGISEDAEKRGFWHASWGPRPRSAGARGKRIAGLLRRAPRLLPISHARYLLAEPCRPGNPVISIAESDVELFGPTLKTFLLREYGNILGIDWRPAWEEEYAKLETAIRCIPFWGSMLG